MKFATRYTLYATRYTLHAIRCTLALAFLFYTLHATRYTLDVFADTKPAATVNGVAITETEVDAMIEQMLPELSFHPELAIEKKDRYRKDAVERLVVSELLYQEAVKLGITVPAEDVRKALDAQKGQFKAKAEFDEALKQKGITEAEYERAIRQAMTIEKLVKQKIDEPSRPSDSEVKDYYEANKKRFVEPEKIRLNEIFIFIEPLAEENVVKEKTEKASEVFGKVKAGGDFCKLAEEYSDDELSGKCGDMGYIHKGRLDAQLEKEVWDMKEGELKMITIDRGIMIAKFKERKPERKLSFDEIKPRIERQLANEKRKKISEDFINSLREKAKIEIYDK